MKAPKVLAQAYINEKNELVFQTTSSNKITVIGMVFLGLLRWLIQEESKPKPESNIVKPEFN